jgi:hypothetical protein
MARVDVSMLLSLLLASHSAGGGVSPIGMVIHADRAHVGVARHPRERRCTKATTLPPMLRESLRYAIER